MNSLSIAATGMLAQQMNVEVISNNIANMNTTAYKRSRAEFQDLLYQNYQQVGAASSSGGTVVPSGVKIGTGVSVGAVYRITEQGGLISTGNALDLAVQGRGHMMVDLPNGQIAYTRAGALQLSPEGKIVTPEGFTIRPGITIPTNAVTITVNLNGEVWVKLDSQVALQKVGQIDFANFANDAGLLSTGDNLFLETTASGTATVATPGSAGYGTLRQGYLEISNVNTVSEITNLITAQRAYEMNSKVIQTSDDMMGTLTNLR